MLDEESVRGHIVPVDDEAGVGGVDRPAHTVAMVSAPTPNVVENHVIAVDHEAESCLSSRRAANAEEHVLNGGGVRGRTVTAKER